MQKSSRLWLVVAIVIVVVLVVILAMPGQMASILKSGKPTADTAAGACYITTGTGTAKKIEECTYITGNECNQRLVTFKAQNRNLAYEKYFTPNTKCGTLLPTQ